MSPKYRKTVLRASKLWALALGRAIWRQRCRIHSWEDRVVTL